MSNLLLGPGIQFQGTDKIGLDYNASATWTGRQAFALPVIFAPKQVFSISQMYQSGQTQGDLTCFLAGTWNRLPLGRPGTVLVAAGKQPTWATIDLNTSVSGVLPVASGGTGKSGFAPHGVIFAQSNTSLDALQPGDDGDVLTMHNGVLSWQMPSAGQTKGTPLALPVWSADGTLADSSLRLEQNRLSLTPPLSTLSIADGETQASISLVSGSSECMEMSFRAEERGAIALRLSDSHQAMSLVRVTSDNAETMLFGVSSAGVITGSTVPAERLTGILPVTKGGTGNMVYSRGDILIAIAPKVLTRLSSSSCDGMVLTVVDGLPTWRYPEKTNMSSMFGCLTLSAGTRHEACLLFTAGEHIAHPCPGAMEWDGMALTFTDSDARRHPIAFRDTDILARAMGVTGIVELQHGGTGNNLEKIPEGSLLVRSSVGMTSLRQGKTGQVLSSRGCGNTPDWVGVVCGVAAGRGMVATGDETLPTLAVDMDFAPQWNGAHSFSQDVTLQKSATLRLSAVGGAGGQAPLQLRASDAPHGAEPGAMWYDGQHLYFRTEGSTVRLTDASVGAKATVYLPLTQGLDPSDTRMLRVRVPVPYSPSNGRIQTKWHLRRLDFRAEIAPVEAVATAEIFADNEPLLEAGISIRAEERTTYTTEFLLATVSSGQELSISCRQSGDSDIWSIYLLLEMEG